MSRRRRTSAVVSKPAITSELEIQRCGFDMPLDLHSGLLNHRMGQEIFYGMDVYSWMLWQLILCRINQRPETSPDSTSGRNWRKLPSKRLPIKLVYCEEYDRVDDAFYREKQVQGWRRAKREALINGDQQLLPALAKKIFDRSKIEKDNLVNGELGGWALSWVYRRVDGGTRHNLARPLASAVVHLHLAQVQVSKPPVYNKIFTWYYS